MACAVMLAVGVAHAGDGQISGRLQNKTAYRVAGDGAVSEFDSLLQIEWEHQWDGWAARAIARGRYENELEPVSYREAEIRELTLTRRTRDYTITVGRQQVVWGKTDGLRLLDIVNPLDLREFILDEYVDSRIPLWMVNAEVFRGEQAWQVLVIPDRRDNRWAVPGGEFFLAAPLPGALPTTLRPVQEPDGGAANWEYGFRWSVPVGRIDLSINGFYGWNDTPTLITRLLPGPSAEVTPRVTRSRVLGVAGDVPVAAGILRFELASTPDEYREVATPAGIGQPLRHHALRYALGYDWLRNNWLVSPQFFHEIVLDPHAALIDDARRHYWTLLVRKTWRQDRLGLQAFYLYGPERRDEWFAPRLWYQFFGRLELRLGADFFDGRPDGLFGRFGDRDRVTVEAMLKF